MISFRSLDRRRWLAPVVVSAGWLGLGAVAGLLSALASDTLPSLRAAAPPVLAGVLWVPLTFGVAALGRRVPWDRRRVHRFVAIHLPAAVATSFLLNVAFFAVEGLVGLVPVDRIAELAGRTAVQWLHLNVAGYGASLLAIHLLDGGSGPEEVRDPPSLQVTTGARRTRLPLADIEWIEADGDYARVHAGGRSYLVSRRMKALADELASASFVRVHRSAIVNARRVREVRHRSHGDYDAVLSDGTVVRVSRTRRDALFGWLEARGGEGGVEVPAREPEAGRGSEAADGAPRRALGRGPSEKPAPGGPTGP